MPKFYFPSKFRKVFSKRKFTEINLELEFGSLDSERRKDISELCVYVWQLKVGGRMEIP